MDGAGSYSVAHRAGLLPTELTGMWGWILLRYPHEGRGGHPQPPPPQSKGLASSRPTQSQGRGPQGEPWCAWGARARVGAGPGCACHGKAHLWAAASRKPPILGSGCAVPRPVLEEGGGVWNPRVPPKRPFSKSHFPPVKDVERGGEAGLPLRKKTKGSDRQRRSLLPGQDKGKIQEHRSIIEQWLAVGSGWRLAAAGGWWRLAVCGRRLVAVGIVRWAAVGGWGFVVGAVLNIKKNSS